MPLCECGKTLTDIRSLEVLERWAHRQGDAWDYRENGTPYWKNCQQCHAKIFPHDRRRNRWCLPAPACLHVVGSRRSGAIAARVSGDFWLTSPPPERISVVAQSSSSADGRRVAIEDMSSSTTRAEQWAQRLTSHDVAQNSSSSDGRRVRRRFAAAVEEMPSSAARSVQWAQPLKEVFEIPRDQMQRCLFLGEGSADVCSARGCAARATTLVTVRIPTSDVRHCTFLCVACGGQHNKEVKAGGRLASVGELFVEDLESNVRPF